MAHISFSVIRFLIYHGLTMIWSNPSVRYVSMNAEPRGEKVRFLGWLCRGQCACRRHWLLACTSSLLSNSHPTTFKSGGAYAPKSRFGRRVAASNRAFAETRPPIWLILRPNSSRIVYDPSFFQASPPISLVSVALPIVEKLSLCLVHLGISVCIGF